MSFRDPRRRARRRRRLGLALSIGAVLITVGVAVGSRSANPHTPTPIESARLACQTTTEELQLSYNAVIGYQLHNVGAPQALIVTPSCRVNGNLPKSDPNRFLADVCVYILVTHQQLQGLGLLTDHPLDNYPYELDSVAINSLVMPNQRAAIEAGSDGATTSFYVIAAPLPTQTLAAGSGSYDTAPFNLLTGMRYASLPFRQRNVYNVGPPILLPSNQKTA